MGFWQGVRAGSALFTGAGFLFGLSERTLAYLESGRDTGAFCLLACAAIFAAINSLNYPWHILQPRPGQLPDAPGKGR